MNDLVDDIFWHLGLKLWIECELFITSEGRTGESDVCLPSTFVSGCVLVIGSSRALALDAFVSGCTVSSGLAIVSGCNFSSRLTRGLLKRAQLYLRWCSVFVFPFASDSINSFCDCSSCHPTWFAVRGDYVLSHNEVDFIEATNRCRFWLALGT